MSMKIAKQDQTLLKIAQKMLEAERGKPGAQGQVAELEKDIRLLKQDYVDQSGSFFTQVKQCLLSVPRHPGAMLAGLGSAFVLGPAAGAVISLVAATEVEDAQGSAARADVAMKAAGIE